MSIAIAIYVALIVIETVWFVETVRAELLSGDD